MICSDNLVFYNSSYSIINSSLFYNKYSDKLRLSPLLVFAHGFKGFKDWGGFPYFCTELAKKNFFVLSFNFSHNGVQSSAPMDFTRLDLFAENTHTIELDDINSVLNNINSISDNYPVDIKRTGLIGHSRGGGISIIAAADNPKVKALVTLASVSSFNRFTGEQKKRWRQYGYIEIPNTRTNQMMRMNINLLNDIENNSGKLDILNAVKRLNKPYMIIHGREDLAVKYTDAELIYNSCRKDLTKLHLLENTGHTFGVQHPFNGSTNAFENVIKLTSDFFTEKLT